MDDKIELIRFMGEMEGYLRGLLLSYDLPDDVYASIAKKTQELQVANNELVMDYIDATLNNDK